jgi:enoyl-CoA hydratase/carnithine racemase
VVGLGRAKELIMTARTIDAAEAERIGLVNRVVAPDELEQATQALVDELLANSHVAVGRAKRVIDASARPALAQTLEMEVAVQEYCVAAARESAREAEQAQDAATPVVG